MVSSLNEVCRKHTIKDKNGKYHEPTTEEVMNKIWK
mgnify:CR=1 FL=1